MLLDLEAELGREGLIQHGGADARRQGARCMKAVVAQPTGSRHRPHPGYAVTFGCELARRDRLGKPRSTRSGHPVSTPRSKMGRKLMREHSRRRHPPAAVAALAGAGAIDVLERDFGVKRGRRAPKRSCGNALRRCGVNDKIEGFGRLLRSLIAPKPTQRLRGCHEHTTRELALLRSGSCSGGLAPDIRAAQTLTPSGWAYRMRSNTALPLWMGRAGGFYAAQGLKGRGDQHRAGSRGAQSCRTGAARPDRVGLTSVCSQSRRRRTCGSSPR